MVDCRDLFAYELRMKEMQLAAAIQKDDEGERKRRSASNSVWNEETRKLASSPLRALLEELTDEHDRRLLEYRQNMNTRVEHEQERIRAILVR